MASTPDLVDYLRKARTLGASDVHVAVGAPPAARVDGVLHPLDEYDVTAEISKDLVFGILTEAQRARLEEELELDFALEVEGTGRYRGNAHYARRCVEASFRYISEEVPSLEKLGHGDPVKDLCKARQGLVLVTGITGSGKSTTIASMIKKISEERSCVIITIEDPIEFVFDHSYGLVKQREVGNDSHSFSDALRASLRQDPDVIVVSEMRDLETIRTAITAAETGHLVISTVHTMDAPKTLDRLIDVFPAEQQPQVITQLANALVGIVSQRLLPAKSGKGRVLASEIMKNTHPIASVIRDQKFAQLPGLIQISSKDGMHTMDDSLIYLARMNAISAEEAIANAKEKAYVQRELVTDSGTQKPR